MRPPPGSMLVAVLTVAVIVALGLVTLIALAHH